MGAQSSQLKCEAPKKLIYFGVKAVALPATIALEIGNVDYEAQKVDMDGWKDLKPTMPTGVLPVAVMADGSMLPESGAIQRMCAAAVGLLGEGKDFYTSELLMGLNNDLNKKVSGNVPTAFTVADWTAEKTQNVHDKVKPEVLEFLKKYEQFLKGDKFTTSGITIGEIELFCKLDMFKAAIPEVLEGGLKAFYARMGAVPGVKKVMDGKSKFGELADYMVPLP